MSVPIHPIPSRIDPFTGLPVMDQQQTFAKDGQTMVVGMLSRFHDSTRSAQQPAQAPARVYSYADACMGLYAVQTAPSASNGHIRDAAILSEQNYQAKCRKLAFESGATNISAAERNSAPPAVVAEVQYEMRKHYLANAYKTEDEV